MALDKPVHAPETVDGTAGPAVAAPVALGSAVHGDLEQMFTHPNFWPGQAGGES